MPSPNWNASAPNIGNESQHWSARFLAGGASPATAHEFEREVATEIRELGRAVTSVAYNACEPKDPQQTPHHVQHEGHTFRRLNAPTPNRQVATLFGKITLRRRGYRDVERTDAAATIFPLEMSLGLVAGATPALASEAARAMAEAGATQQTVLARMKQQHGVEWGVKKLREVTQHVSTTMTPLRREHQARQLVAWLRQAQQQKGSGRPVLAVGRDGITLRTRPHRCYEVGTTGTLTVYDRRGQRLGSVYLGYVPELGQEQMTQELTALITETLRQFDGPTPRLAYLTDAGDAETKYFRQALRKMRHPQTNERLAWQWIVDFYHASERLSVMAAALFGEEQAAQSWSRRMAKLLKQPNGVFRVLHSAAAMKSRRPLSKTKQADFRRAYDYLRRHSRHMQYAEFRRQRLPIGSGVTEAGCKTVFTQRLKLSGMLWSKPGAQVILDLRVILLSGIWDEVYAATLARPSPPPPRAHTRTPDQSPAALPQKPR